MVDGELDLQPRPAGPHLVAASGLGEELGPPFKRGKGRPGGWMILGEPELHLGPDILVSDLAGWRRERLPMVPDEAFITVAPDWVCEVLSPSTARKDRVRKVRICVRERVGHLWLMDPATQILKVLALDGETYRLAMTASELEKVRPVPFDAIELDLAILRAR